MKVVYQLISFLVFCTLIVSCGEEEVYLPRPRAYPKIEYPNREVYLQLTEEECPFVLHYPDYLEYKKSTQFFDEDIENLCWFNLHYPGWNADLYMTYHPIGVEKSFQELVDDAFEMANKHISNAEYISEVPIRTQRGVGGIFFEMEGASASSIQFFATDSSSHFLRGALYFQSRVVPDSLAPMIEYMKVDVVDLIEKIEWK